MPAQAGIHDFLTKSKITNTTPPPSPRHGRESGHPRLLEPEARRVQTAVLGPSNMRIKTAIAFGLGISVSLTSCVANKPTANNAHETPARPVFENESDCVPPKTLPTLKSIALAGNGAAAWVLSRAYNFCAEEMADGEYWAHVAAEDDPQFQRPYASVLDEYPYIDDQLRSLFWRNIDYPNLTVSLLLPPAQHVLDNYNKQYARLASPAWLASPDVGIGTVREVKSFNALHTLDHAISVSSVTPKSLWPLRVDALLGAPNAANALADHYYSADNYEVFFYWKTIAAEDGDPGAELFLSETYGVTGLDDQRARAAFWAARAIRDANTPQLKFESRYAQSHIQALLKVTPNYMPVPPS